MTGFVPTGQAGLNKKGKHTKTALGIRKFWLSASIQRERAKDELRTCVFDKDRDTRA